MSNLALRLAGPAVITYRGATFASVGDIQLQPENETFDVEVDAHGKVDERASNKVLSVRFRPVGTWANLAVLFPALLQQIGQYTTPVRSFDSANVNTTTDVITSPAHGYLTGDTVTVFSFGTLPTGLVAGTIYFVRSLTADTLTLHTSRANAVANTGRVDITAAGSGTHRLIQQEPLVITSAENEGYTFHVAAVASMPEITAAATAQLFGEVVFDVFRRVNLASTVANSLYTLGTGTYTPPNIDPAQILTQPYTFSWGLAPWAGLETVAGIRIRPEVQLENIEDDTVGVIGKRVSGFNVTATAQPLGIAPSAVLDALLMQGAGAQRGGRLGTSNNFVVNGAGVTITLTGAGLRSAPHAFGRQADRIGELEWFASRTFTAGLPNPLLTVA